MSKDSLLRDVSSREQHSEVITGYLMVKKIKLIIDSDSKE